MNTVDIRTRLVRDGSGKIFRIEKIDREGYVYGRDVDGYIKDAKALLKIDPLTQCVHMSNYSLMGRDFFSEAELGSIAGLNRGVGEKLWNAVAYKSSRDTYVLVFESIIGMRYIYYIKYPDIYGIRIKGGYLIHTESDYLDESISGISEFGKSESTSWIRKATLYKCRNVSANPNLMQVLGRLLFACPEEYLVKLRLWGKNFASTDLIGTVSYVNDIDKEVIICRQSEAVGIAEGFNYHDRISRQVISRFFENVYDKPCPYFEKDELEKARDILIQNGYTSIADSLVKYNGVRANFYINDDEYLCIRDRDTESGYSLYRLKINQVKTIMGKRLYYEIRMYPLCDERRFQVVFRSVRYESCLRLIGHPYPNLIRGNGIYLKGEYDRFIVGLRDEYSTFTIKYRNTDEASKTLSAVYDKELGRFVGDVRSEDLEFLERALGSFDDMSGVRSLYKTRYLVYEVKDNRVIVSSDNLLFASLSGFSCAKELSSYENGKYYIVKYKGSEVSAKTLYNPKAGVLGTLDKFFSDSED